MTLTTNSAALVERLVKLLVVSPAVSLLASPRTLYQHVGAALNATTLQLVSLRACLPFSNGITTLWYDPMVA